MAEGGGALKEIFAEFGFEFSTDVIARGEAVLEQLLGALDRVSESVDVLADRMDDVAPPTDGASEAVGELTEKAKESESVVDKFGKRLLQFAAVKAAFSWIEGVAGETDRLVTRFGLLTEQAAALRTAARGNAGDVASWEKALKTLSLNTGTSLSESYDQLRLFADQLAAIPDPAKRAEMAQKMLGNEAAKLLPVLEKGSRGLDELENKTRSLGGGFSGPGAEGLLKFNNMMGDVATVGESIFVRVLEKVADAFGGVTTKLEDITGPIFEVIDNSRILEVVLGALTGAAVLFGIKAAIAWVAATWPLLLLAAAVAGVLLVVEDLIVGFEGGESVIADFIDSIFGVGAASEIFDKIRAAWDSTVDAFNTGVEFVKNVFSDLMNLFSGGPSVIGEMIDSLLGIGAAETIVNSLKEGFATVWGLLEKIGGFAVKVLKPVFSSIFGGASSAGAAVGEGVTNFNERFRQINTPAAMQAPPSARDARSASVETNQTTNLNINTSPSNRELTSMMQAAIREENERAARDVEDALVEVM